MYFDIRKFVVQSGQKFHTLEATCSKGYLPRRYLVLLLWVIWYYLFEEKIVTPFFEASCFIYKCTHFNFKLFSLSMSPKKHRWFLTRCRIYLLLIHFLTIFLNKFNMQLIKSNKILNYRFLYVTINTKNTLGCLYHFTIVFTRSLSSIELEHQTFLWWIETQVNASMFRIKALCLL